MDRSVLMSMTVKALRVEAEKLGVKPEEILYVGNSIKYDVMGARNYGMKTAYLLKGFRKIFNIKCSLADISFKNYRQLKNIVLK